jgi:hypothetical protein
VVEPCGRFSATRLLALRDASMATHRMVRVALFMAASRRSRRRCDDFGVHPIEYLIIYWLTVLTLAILMIVVTQRDWSFIL